MDKYQPFFNEKEQDFIEALGEAVGANVRLKVDKYKEFIKPYMQTYTVYRYWPDDVKNIPKQAYYNTSLSLDAIRQMCKENDLLSGPITKHTGRGIDVMNILKNALPYLTKEKSFIEGVIKNNEYQKEIFYFGTISAISKDNVVAWYDEHTGKVDPYDYPEQAATANWYKTFPKIYTSYGIFDVDVYLNPTPRDYREMEMASETNIVRFIATSDKKLYAWCGNILHNYIVKKLAPKLKTRKFITLEGVRIGNKTLLTNSNEASIQEINGSWDWLYDYMDVSRFHGHACVVGKKGKMKNKIIEEIRQLNPLLAIDASYALGVKVEAQPGVVKQQMLEAIHSATGISVPARRITIKKTGGKENYTFTEDDTIFRITGKNGTWTFMAAIPRIGARGLGGVDTHEAASFFRSGHSKSIDEIMVFFRKALGEAVMFLRMRKFAFDTKGNIVST